MSDHTARLYELVAAQQAGAIIGAFPSQELAQQFYDATHGPLPFATKLFRDDDGLRSAFVQGFLASFKATGFPIYSRVEA